MQNESEILQSLLRKDPAACELFIRTHSPRLLAVATRILRNEADAHDALQEAFIQAFKSLPAFEQKSSLATWLHQITVRSALMKLRKKKQHPETSIDHLLPTYAWNGHQNNPAPAWPASTLRPDAPTLQHETQRVVREAIDKLPEIYRNVLLLRDIEELSTEDTASLLEVTDSVVKTRLHRARQALKSLLDAYMTEKGAT